MVYCERCDRYFSHWEALYQHKRDSYAHWVCEQCDRDFNSQHARKEHWVQSSLHSYCQYCEEHFDDDEELELHYDLYHYRCRPCNWVFKNEYGLQEHYRQSSAHHYCFECKRDFSSENSLRSHLQSSVHQPRNVSCPFRLQGCNQLFVSRSALVQHLEMGRCPSGVDRNTVNRIVRQLDRQNIITDPSRLIAGSDNSSNIPPPQYLATQKSWNGSAYECYFCHATFRLLSALNQHLNSPRHQEKVYFCPLSSCRVRFNTLSALCQHIESERCGVSKFKAVQNALDGLVGGMKMLTM
ncbi:hypothetical protein PM082_003805 [Marasmius tenuissimus]|nr:hypothetical protein PM082_003805 [Marasmius tenuissimus]